MSIENVAPFESRCGARFTFTTVDEPSNSLWRRGSASSAKTADAGALMTREAETERILAIPSA
jgi:hypothetical protein